MIITLQECKTLLNITNSIKDNQISMLLPIIEDEIREYCNNKFLDSSSQYSSNTIEFDKSTNSIIDLYGNFTSSFYIGMQLDVFGSRTNDGIYQIKSLSDTNIQLESGYTVNNEDETIEIVLSKIDYPKLLKLIAAQMIDYQTNGKKDIEQETFSRYQVTYNTQSNTLAYPNSIIKSLNKFRKVY